MTNADEKKTPMNRGLLFVLVGVGLILVLSAAVVVKKWQRDRQAALQFEPRPPMIRTQQNTGQPVTRTYSQKDIEDARKSGKPLPGLPPQPIQPNTAANDAVQRSMRTLDEINRINEMNRRLMEQQQKNQPR